MDTKILMTVTFNDGTQVNIITPEKAEMVRKFLLGSKAKLKTKTGTYHLWTADQEDILIGKLAGFTSVRDAKKAILAVATEIGVTHNAVVARAYKLKVFGNTPKKEPITV